MQQKQVFKLVGSGAAVLIFGSAMFLYWIGARKIAPSETYHAQTQATTTVETAEDIASVISIPPAQDRSRAIIQEALSAEDGPLWGNGPRFPSDVTVDLQGSRYTLVHYSHSVGGTLYAVIDLQTKAVTSYQPSGSYVFKNRANAFYAIEDTGMMYSYKLDQPGFAVIPTADFGGSFFGDSYNSNVNSGLVKPLIRQQSETEITLAVFQRSKYDEEQDAYIFNIRRDSEGNEIPDRYVTIKLP